MSPFQSLFSVPRFHLSAFLCVLFGLLCASGWVNAQVPSNDQPCNALFLPMDSALPLDNRLATVDLYEVSPGAGTGINACAGNDGWCPFDIEVQASVYFRFTAPASGAVSILADGFDTQIACWEVADCNNYLTFAEVGANDDSGYRLGGAIGSAGLIELACLTPGAEYLLQVDGFNGATGTGTISINDCRTAPLTLEVSPCQTRYLGYPPVEDDTVYVRAFPQGGFPPYTITWSADSSVIYENPDSCGLAVQPEVSTAYLVTVTDAKGCSVSEVAMVQVESVRGCLGGGGIGSGNFAARLIRMCDGSTEVCVSIGDVPNMLARGYQLGACGNTCVLVTPGFPPPAVCETLTLGILGDLFAPWENSWSLTDLTTNQVVDSRAMVFGNYQTYTYCLDPTHCYAFTITDLLGDGFSLGGGYSISFQGQTQTSTFYSGTTTLFSETTNFGNCGSRSLKRNLSTGLELQAYPNPFREEAHIDFTLPEDDHVSLEVWSVSGSKVATLFDGAVEGGVGYSFSLSASGLQSGMYFYRLRSRSGLDQKGKLVLAR